MSLLGIDAPMIGKKLYGSTGILSNTNDLKNPKLLGIRAVNDISRTSAVIW